MTDTTETDIVDVIAAAICHTAHGMEMGSWCANCRSKADHIWAPVLLEALDVGARRELFSAYVAAERDRAVREALTPVRALVEEWQRELDTRAIRDSNARYCWSTAARELRAALPDDREDRP